MNDQVQQLQSEVVQLKARVLDSLDNAQRLGQVLSTIAQAINYQGQDFDGLVSAVGALAKQTQENQDE